MNTMPSTLPPLTGSACLSARIGMYDATQLFGLTARALRFYEDKGLVTAHRDRRNHRYYDRTARARLAWIARLRSAGVPLPEIEAILEAEVSCGGGRKLALAALARRRRALEAALARVEAAWLAFDGEPDRRNGRP